MEKAPSEAENPRQRQSPNQVVNSYVLLLKQVRQAGLLRRRRGFYITVFVILMAAWAGTWTGFILLADTWFQLLIAAGMGVVLTQFGFLAHEAAHRQIFASKGMNEWSARLIGTGLVGISYAMWTRKHTRHHNHPNMIDKDPDIHTGAIAFHPQAAASRTGLMIGVTRRQGWLLFPLLFFLGLSMFIMNMWGFLSELEAGDTSLSSIPRIGWLYPLLGTLIGSLCLALATRLLPKHWWLTIVLVMIAQLWWAAPGFVLRQFGYTQADGFKIPLSLAGLIWALIIWAGGKWPIWARYAIFGTGYIVIVLL